MVIKDMEYETPKPGDKRQYYVEIVKGQEAREHYIAKRFLQSAKRLGVLTGEILCRTSGNGDTAHIKVRFSPSAAPDTVKLLDRLMQDFLEAKIEQK